MINYMIDLKRSKRYCTDYTKIENYEQAINDNTQTYICHHKNGITLNCDSKKLKDMGLYYDRPPEEFIFLTQTEHASLHNKGNSYNKGKKHTEEHKRKNSELHKGSKNPRAIECTINGKTYGCIKDAWLDICPDTKYITFYKRLNNNYYN